MAGKRNRKWGESAESLNKDDRIIVEKMIGVYTGSQKYKFNGFYVLPVKDFFNELLEGNIY